MVHRKTGGYSRKSLSLACLALSVSLFLPALFASPAAAADVVLSSKTYLLFYERQYAGGQKNQYAPLYEYLSADATNLGGKPFSMHFYGWGRVDLGDDSGTGSTSGAIGSFYLEYQHPEGNAQAKVGQFFLTEGAAMAIIDGAYVKVTTPVGLGVSLYGGVPVEYSILDNGVKGGSALYGGRLFYVKPGLVEIGATYLKENGDFVQGKDLQLYGGDLWWRVAGPVELTGKYTYNQAMGETASQRYAIRILPTSTFDIAAGYEQYSYLGLFQAALNPAFLPPSLNLSDKVSAFFGVLSWEFVPQWTLTLGDKYLHHDLSNPGNANRAEIGLRYSYNDKKDTAGLSAAFVSASQDVNEYQEYRGFATYSPGKLRLTLDALTQLYKQEIYDKKNQTQVVGTAGYQILASLQLSGNVTYTQSPNFQEDWEGLIRVTYDFGTSTGGKK